MVKRSVVWDFVPGTVLLDSPTPTGDDNGPGNYAYPTSGDFHPGAFDLQRFQVIDSGDRHRVPGADPRPEPHLRQSARARSWSTSMCTTRPPRPRTSTARRSRSATTSSRRPTPGAGWSRCRASASAMSTPRHDPRHGHHPGQPVVAVHHVQRAESDPRYAGARLGVHRRAHRSGRLQPRPGPRVRADAGRVLVRCVRDRECRSTLYGRPGCRTQGGGRGDARRSRAGGRARLHRARPPVAIQGVVIP